MNKYFVKKISKEELNLLVKKRNILYDQILNLNIEKKDLIKEAVEQINKINIIIDFFFELNRYVFNKKLNINFQLINDKLFFSIYSDLFKVEKILEIDIEYVEYFDTMETNSCIFDYRNYLEWIKKLNISFYVDKLSLYYSKYIMETKDIKENKTKSNPEIISKELFYYKKLLSENFCSEYNFYMKGGFVIGFAMIKIIYSSCLKKEYEKEIILDTLDFIRDFDFVLEINSNNNLEIYSKKLEEFLTLDIFKKYFRKEGTVITVIRAKENYKLSNNESFLELAIKNSPNLTKGTGMIDLELPMTTMKINIDSSNIDIIFDIIYTYWKIIEGSVDLNLIDFKDLIKKIVKLDINIYSATNIGLFDVSVCDYGSKCSKLSIDAINIIEKTANKFNHLKKNILDKSIEQFLASGQNQPDRIFMRLLNKNFKKSKKCVKLLNKYEISSSNITWLLDKKNILEIISKFFKNLAKKYIDWNIITEIHNTNSSNCLSFVINNFIKSNNIGKLSETLFMSSNLGRLIGEFNKLKYCDLKKKIKVYNLAKIIFGKNITHEIRINFQSKDIFNIVRLQKSFCDLSNWIIMDKIYYSKFS